MKIGMQDLHEEIILTLKPARSTEIIFRKLANQIKLDLLCISKYF